MQAPGGRSVSPHGLPLAQWSPPKLWARSCPLWQLCTKQQSFLRLTDSDITTGVLVRALLNNPTYRRGAQRLADAM